MTKRQEDQYSMWSVTEAVLKQNEAIWKDSVAFANAAGAFRKIRTGMDTEAQTQLQDNTGVTLAKKEDRINLTEQCKQMALNIKSYAVNSKDFVLENQFDFTKSYFKKLRDNDIPVVANAIYNKAVELTEVLGDYGVGADELTDLGTAIERYTGANPAPRLVIGKVKQATSNVSDNFYEGTVQLKLMDNLIGNFNKKQPEFVSAFRNARMVINRSTSRKSKKASQPGTTKQEGDEGSHPADGNKKAGS